MYVCLIGIVVDIMKGKEGGDCMKHAVLITGASSGIGHASARLFARKGYDLILVGRNQDALKELEEELSFINVEVLNVVKDLSKKHAVEELYEMLKEYPIEILMNNAGFGDYGKFLESDYRKNRDMIRVNILALTEMTYRFGNLMVERGKGKILNVASIAGLCPGPYMNVYYATKAYVLSFSEAMAEELKGTGVTCTCLCPGPTQTNFWQRANVTASPIMKFFKPDTADHVAYKGVEGLMKKRVVVFNNVSGQLLNLAVRVMPRAVIRKSVGFMNGRR